MIELAAYQGTSFISRAIRWQTRSKYSHIAARFTDHADIKAPLQFGHAKIVSINPGNVIEAWGGGVRLSETLGSVHTPGTQVDIFEFRKPLKRLEFLTAANFLCAQIGKPYDYLAIVRFLTREPEHRWNKKKWFCSELCFEAMLTAGRELLERTPAWKVPPAWISMSPALKLVRTETTVKGS